MKKDAAWAVRTMSEWLASPMEHGASPTACELYYRKTIPTDAGAEPCFLVRWQMADGHESVGFTGPITWSFIDLPLAEIEQIPARWRQRRLLNLYVGWWYVFTAAQSRAKAPLTAKQTVEAVKVHLQRKGYSYALRSPRFVESATIAGVYYAVVRGTAVHIEKSGSPVRPDRDVYVAVTITPRSKAIKSLSRFDADRPVYGKLPLFHHVGTQLGPFQISRLGRLAYSD